MSRATAGIGRDDLILTARYLEDFALLGCSDVECFCFAPTDMVPLQEFWDFEGWKWGANWRDPDGHPYTVACCSLTEPLMGDIVSQVKKRVKTLRPGAFVVSFVSGDAMDHHLDTPA